MSFLLSSLLHFGNGVNDDVACSLNCIDLES